MLDPGKLLTLVPEKQRGYAPAVLLAMYGVSNAFYHDRKHWLPVPVEMRPRRNRGTKIYTAFISLYLIIMVSILVAFHTYNNFREFEVLDAEKRR